MDNYLSITNPHILLSDVQIKLINIFESKFKLMDEFYVEKLVITTRDLFLKFQSIWPSEDYTPEDLLQVLRYLKVESVVGDSGTKHLWLLQEF